MNMPPRWSKKAYTTVSNRWKYGWHAPVYSERLWVCTSEVKRASSLKFRRLHSGQVKAFAGPSKDKSVFDVPKIAMCLSHWQDGVPWDETGIIDYMLEKIARSKYGIVDGVRNYDEVVGRYDELDRVFDTVVREGRLRTRKELSRKAVREEGGIIIHIDASGEPIFGHGGHHRLAIAISAGLERFPALVGMVHPEALGHLPRYRA